MFTITSAMIDKYFMPIVTRAPAVEVANTAPLTIYENGQQAPGSRAVIEAYTGRSPLQPGVGEGESSRGGRVGDAACRQRDTESIVTMPS